MINDRGEWDWRSSWNHGCHGNLFFLCTDWGAQDGGKETIYEEFPYIVQEIDL